ncbi:Frag1/DRAM/Sfk1 [Carpediemonas membranifera]|uniref:Frag1/DRAM/Sfk1 n=1 Tax=Carpediemonas membranifera TaxID=201153 RepID=A0A8J6E631_9EUKA|nr:Frag1/DRAM/Sfk1 [Carpediemonas membranifera]|eukprot:KAG9396622.1 Frag1/DRAM/Sfk1 [Carpediemonas membranifera]
MANHRPMVKEQRPALRTPDKYLLNLNGAVPLLIVAISVFMSLCGTIVNYLLSPVARNYLPTISEAALQSKPVYGVTMCVAGLTLPLGAFIITRRIAPRHPAATVPVLALALVASAGVMYQGIIPLDMTLSMDTHRAAAGVFFAAAFVLCCFLVVLEFTCRRVTLAAVARVLLIATIVGTGVAVPLVVGDALNNVNFSRVEEMNETELPANALTKAAIVQWTLVSTLIAFAASYLPDARKMRLSVVAAGTRVGEKDE